MPKFAAQPYEHEHENEVVLFGQTNFRNQMRKFGIKTDDRRRHIYVVGKTGMGKSTLLENMFLADVYAGHGVAYIDPHGDTAETFLNFIPPHRINDVVYFNPADMEFPIGFNILETVDESQKHLVASGLMGVFKKIWPDVWSSRMEYILLNTIMALLDYPGSTLLGINRLLSDEEFRMRVVSLIQDPVVKTFWVKEFASFSEKYRTEAVAPLQNKVGQFLSATVIRNIVAQVKSTIDMREIMDTRKIFIVNLSKGRIGEENSRLLGAMVITRLQLTAMERVDMPEKERQDFYLYVDEFQNFATESFANILSEARKYRLSLIVAHQYIEQLDETVRAAIFGNVGTIVSFRVGAADAAFMEGEFMPRFTPEDLVNLKKYEVYLKLMIDGASSEPFSAQTLPPIAEVTGSREKVIRVSRERYATPRKVIEEKVVKWSGFGTADTGQKLLAEDEVPDEEEKMIAQRIEELSKTSPDVGEYARPAEGGGFGGKKKAAAPKKPMFEVPCAVCGKISELTFEPDWSKPWFCKEHLEAKQNGQITKAQLAKLIPAGVALGRPGFAAAPSASPAAPAAVAAPAAAPVAASAPKPATPAAPAPKPPAPKPVNPQQKPPSANDPIPKKLSVTPPPPKINAAAVPPSTPKAPQPKPAAAPAAKSEPVSLSALPSREGAEKRSDRFAKQAAPKLAALKDAATQKPAAPAPKPPAAPAQPPAAPKPAVSAPAAQTPVPANDAAGIPTKEHKPRIVTDSSDADWTAEISSATGAAPVVPAPSPKPVAPAPQPAPAPKPEAPKKTLAELAAEPLSEPTKVVKEVSFLDSLAEADRRAHNQQVGGGHGHMPSVATPPAAPAPKPAAPPAAPAPAPKPSVPPVQPPPAQPPAAPPATPKTEDGWQPDQVIKFD